MITVTALFLAGALIFHRGPQIGPRGYIVFGVLLSALILRLVIAANNNGFESDLTCFYHWGARINRLGFSNFYQAGYFADYPPAYLYALYLLVKMGSLADLSDQQWYLLLKIPSICFDMLLALFVYKVAKTRGDGKAVWCLILIAFNPTVIGNSSYWGQVDSILACFMLFSLWRMSNKKTFSAMVLFAIALALKPQALIFCPVVIIYLIYRKNLKEAAVSIAGFAATFAVIIIPFVWNKPFDFIFKLYFSTIAHYKVATYNAWNFYFAAGGNTVSTEAKMMYLSYGLWSKIFIALITLAAFAAYSKHIREKNSLDAAIFKTAFFLITATFLFAASMHERYLYLAIPLALLCHIATKNKIAYVLFVAYSVINALNMIYANKYDEYSYVSETEALAFAAASALSICLVLAFLFKKEASGSKNFNKL